MFIYAVKGSTLKFTAALILSLAVLVLLVIFLPAYDGDALPTLSIDGKEVTFHNIRTDKERRDFLTQFGWTVSDKEPFYEEVSIPKEFDSVFAAYNDLQKSQGLDLSRYGGKICHHYRYEITNFDTGETVYANLLIYRGRVIGGDISSAKMNGFSLPFTGKDKAPSTE
ncbi:MAG: DUF4830 domain-containing protein [Clostridia bacterium]|nr:DUF4830 domain-containing protein [Clostridia bacterium]